MERTQIFQLFITVIAMLITVPIASGKDIVVSTIVASVVAITSYKLYISHPSTIQARTDQSIKRLGDMIQSPGALHRLSRRDVLRFEFAVNDHGIKNKILAASFEHRCRSFRLGGVSTFFDAFWDYRREARIVEESVHKLQEDIVNTLLLEEYISRVESAGSAV